MSIIERFFGRKKKPQPKDSFDMVAYQLAQQRAAERPLRPLLQKHSGVVEQFAKTHGLKVKVWDGQFSLEKEFLGGHPDTVVGVRDNEQDHIAINVYSSGQEGFLTLASRELLEPIHKGGDDVVLINRDVRDHSIGGLIVVDTRETREI